jgi:hypothetical protein
MDAHEMSKFAMKAFAMGDSNVGQEDHHGTPKQQYCASVWGASPATSWKTTDAVLLGVTLGLSGIRKILKLVRLSDSVLLGFAQS